MVLQRYRVYELSARAVMSYAVKVDGVYQYDLNPDAVSRCLVSSSPQEQESNALFHQILYQLYSGSFQEVFSDDVDESISDIIFYMNFQRVFDTQGLRQREVIRQKKAEDMFRPEGITLDFGNGHHPYLAFERSNSMSRSSQLSFIRADFYEPIRRRMMLDLDIQRCQLSKLYAYNGLLFSTGKRIDGIGIDRKHRVIVVNDHFIKSGRTNVITVTDDGTAGSPRKFHRTNDFRELSINCFDGEGLISRAYAKQIDEAYCGKHLHGSFQIRMPYVKGMLHEVDFHDFFKRCNVNYLRDAWGVSHLVEDVDIILTVSQFKAFGWMNDCGKTWDDYWEAFRKYHHALYITNVSKEHPSAFTQLNYQFLATVSIRPEEFRPADLPLGWDHNPTEDEREWLTKQTERAYYELRRDEPAQREYFLSALEKPNLSKRSKEYAMAVVLKKNPAFIHERVYTTELENRAEQILKDYSVGRLLVAGDIRYLSGDLMLFLYTLAQENISAEFLRLLPFYGHISKSLLYPSAFYAPGAVYTHGKSCTMLRNPHIARNEEIQLNVYDENSMRERYFGHLTDVAMVNAGTLTAERLGGADYDGDLVRTISDPIINACVRRNYLQFNQGQRLDNRENLPLLMIPSLASQKQNANDWQARFETVRNTFSSRIGQICNAALNRSVIAYKESSDPHEIMRCRNETEELAILSGLEIDAAKTGVRPDLSEYLNRSIPRSPFLKYKTMLEESENRRAWYEESNKEKLDAFFLDTNWDAVDSPVERLPYLAQQLKRHTKKPRSKKIPDSQLFKFAAEKDWQAQLNQDTLEKISILLSDYAACLSRIRSCKAPVRNQKRRSDIERILFRRGQEEQFDTDELYALFQSLPTERLSALRHAIQETDWHLMKETQREAFLMSWLNTDDFEDCFDLLTDFRQNGFRVLWDVVADIDDENMATDRKLMHRQEDSEAFTAMMQAYIDRPKAKNYREIVAKECRAQLRDIVKLPLAVRYLVALGKRELLWELMPDMILENVIEVEVQDRAE